MQGIEAITESIKRDSNIKCDEILKNANAKIKELKKESENLIQKEIASMIKSQEAKIEFIFKKSRSVCESIKREEILNAKNEIILNIIEKAKNQIINLETEKYFSFILNFISKFKINKKGKVIFSEKDLRRLPENFKNRIFEISKGDLTVCDLPGKIECGFVLNYGDLEENCSVDSIFKSNYEIFRDIVNNVLFKV